MISPILGVACGETTTLATSDHFDQALFLEKEEPELSRGK